MAALTRVEIRAIHVLMIQSHETYIRQKKEDLQRENKPIPEFDHVPTIHDLERAVDGLEALQEAGLVIDLLGSSKLE